MDLLVSLAKTSSTYENASKHAAEFVSLPWLHSIDPPWLDWQPELHSESAILNVCKSLKKAVGIKYIEKSFQLLLKLPKEEQMAWKLHIFRVSLVRYCDSLI